MLRCARLGMKIYGNHNKIVTRFYKRVVVALIRIHPEKKPFQK
jgi:hypothetical protein